MKKCSDCKQSLNIANFGKDKTTKDGLQYRCKGCRRLYYQKNKDRELARAKRNRPDKATKLEYDRAWRMANAEYLDSYRKKNRIKLNAQKARWRRDNWEVQQALASARRARRKANGVFVILKKELETLYRSKCHICGSANNITLDHVIPISRGGRHSIGNLIPLCGSCNSSKGSKLLSEYLYKVNGNKSPV